ncbi:unnamed protein product [Vitrella brassicaformis CCMP3155]|uniref:PH domain-containing protein n=2 Tax=Vitrella brassicaformis TaxID=1169539 RepID=A0A0G4FR36_VITBC|nr:unnamed protein product [Vitrella brassicaformis CCMP3155]|eukprot:CEM16914.1 unnamed protein product [Vitrella brassicaformis CCMP3155]
MALGSHLSMEVILRKKDGFVALKEFEDDRRARVDAFRSLMAPLNKRAFAMLDDAKAMVSGVATALTQRLQMDKAYIDSLRRSVPHRSLSMESTRGGRRQQTHPTQTSPPSRQSSSASSTGGEGGSGGGKIDCSGANTVKEALRELNRQQALQMEDFVKVASEDLIQGGLQRAAVEYARVSKQHTDRVAAAWSLLETTEKDCRQKWDEYERLFRAVESTQVMSLHPPHDDDHGSSSQGGREGGGGARDCWLLERFYTNAATQSRVAQDAYLKAFQQFLADFEQLEQWRCQTVRHTVNQFLQKLKVTTTHVSSSIDASLTLMQALDPAKVSVAKMMHSEDPFASPAPPHNPAEADAGQSAQQRSARRGSASRRPPLPPQQQQQMQQTRVEDETSVALSAFLSQAEELTKLPNPPQTSLVKKAGIVKRPTSGLFQRQKDGVLVLTYDRFLHLFKSEADPLPATSVSLDLSTVSVVQDHNQPSPPPAPPSASASSGSATPTAIPTIEVQETKRVGPFRMFSSNKRLVFTPLTAGEASSWLEILKGGSAAAGRSATAQRPPPPALPLGTPPPAGSEQDGDGATKVEPSLGDHGSFPSTPSPFDTSQEGPLLPEKEEGTLSAAGQDTLTNGGEAGAATNDTHHEEEGGQERAAMVFDDPPRPPPPPAVPVDLSSTVERRQMDNGGPSLDDGTGDAEDIGGDFGTGRAQEAMSPLPSIEDGESVGG